MRTVSERLGEPRWDLSCDDPQCSFDTYGVEYVHDLAVEHVAETGHTVSVTVKRFGKLERSDA